eukprot:TRINITY_DN9346_c0_g1_i1.p1 TRINITY_DN9346_c0_g1~~TRINITY_DN9346_c0_g1_i1.p1  ORF type:complete len:457 (-),score=125.56 TRINITY_DN9346_c0_g1_i1:91-1461(-)
MDYVENFVEGAASSLADSLTTAAEGAAAFIVELGPSDDFFADEVAPEAAFAAAAAAATADARAAAAAAPAGAGGAQERRRLPWSRPGRTPEGSNTSCCCGAGLSRLFGGRAKPGSGAKKLDADSAAAAAQLAEAEAEAAELYQRSATTLLRQVQADLRACGWPAMHFYDVSSDPPRPFGQDDALNPRRAYRAPVNSAAPVRIDNGCFVGDLVLMHRARPGFADHNPNEWYFADKTRRWELRLQGRFKRRPAGELFVGVVLQDFDYWDVQTWNAQLMMAAVVPLLEAVTGERLYFSWGSRGEDASQPNADLAEVVGGASCFDQLIATPAGETPPDLTGEIAQFGVRRNAMAAAEYRAAARNIADNINTQDTYTFCVWGPSRLIDISRSCFDVLGTSLSYGSLLDEWPAHVVMYSLEADPEDPRHMESRKTYFADALVWTSDIKVPKLPSRYMFLDER